MEHFCKWSSCGLWKIFRLICFFCCFISVRRQWDPTKNIQYYFGIGRSKEKIKRLLIAHKDSSLEIWDLLVFNSFYSKGTDNELHTEEITWRTMKTTVHVKFCAPFAGREVHLRDFSKMYSFYPCYSIIFPP